MFESKVPLCLSGEFIAQPKPGQLQLIGPKRHPRGEWRQRRRCRAAKRRVGEWGDAMTKGP